jgi:AcrR family transcriptional regulator
MTVPEIMQASGLPRSTIYYRLKNGESAREIIASVKGEELTAEDAAPLADVQADPPAVVSPESLDDKAAVEWARSVMWAAEHVHISRMAKRKAGTPMRFTLWQYGRENQKELLVNMVPRALSYLDKAKAGKEPEGVMLAEQKSIDELRALLEQALGELAEAK